jgi:hypothetical protein
VAKYSSELQPLDSRDGVIFSTWRGNLPPALLVQDSGRHLIESHAGDADEEGKGGPPRCGRRIRNGLGLPESVMLNGQTGPC